MRLLELLTVALVLTSAGCGNLSKEKAREILQKKYYDQDSSAYCSIEVRYEGTGSRELYRLMNMLDADANEACIDALRSVGAAKRKQCSDDSTPCRSWLFEPGDKASMSGSRTFRDVNVPCGEKKLLEIESITTEQKTAEVAYRRSNRVDNNMVKMLSACKVTVPKDGVEEKKITFKRDDDGNWADVSK